MARRPPPYTGTTNPIYLSDRLIGIYTMEGAIYREQSSGGRVKNHTPSTGEEKTEEENEEAC